MATVFNRGTRRNPQFVAAYRAGTKPDGKTNWRQRRVPKEFNTTEAAAQEWANEQERTFTPASTRAGKADDAPASDVELFGTLLDRWLKALTNRSADNDRCRVEKHLRPAFAAYRVVDVDRARILRWIDEQRAAEERLADATLRKNLGLLSRFFSWCVLRGHAAYNPVKDIPSSARPQDAPKKDAPWIDDDTTVRKIFNQLRNPVHLMFYICNRAGLRTGEVCGLRVSDFGFLKDGVIRVRFSYDGPLKEDKGGQNKVKWVPAPDDAGAVLGPWLARREAEGAGQEDLLFVAPKGGCMHKEYVLRAWKAAAIAAGVTAPRVKDAKGKLLPAEAAMTWYQGTRHSMVSRNLARVPRSMRCQPRSGTARRS